MTNEVVEPTADDADAAATDGGPGTDAGGPGTDGGGPGTDAGAMGACGDIPTFLVIARQTQPGKSNSTGRRLNGRKDLKSRLGLSFVIYREHCQL